MMEQRQSLLLHLLTSAPYGTLRAQINCLTNPRITVIILRYDAGVAP